MKGLFEMNINGYVIKTGASPTEANLSRADLNGARLTCANLTDANAWPDKGDWSR